MAKKIILISNEPMMHTDIIRPLEAYGYTLVTTTLQGDVLDIIQKEKTDLIILDTHHDPSAAYELCRLIKSHKILHAIPIFLILDYASDYIMKPIAPEVLHAKVKNFLGKPKTGKKKVVIIDDEIDLCKTLSYRFKKWNFDVSIAHDGEEGLRLIKNEIPDLIVLDLRLPKLPGEEVCKKVREDDATDHIPIIMLTAKNTDVDRVIGKVIGANTYLTKPFNVDDLFRKIKEIIQE